MAALLKKHNFRGHYLAAREPDESYADIIEALRSDILIEDDCKSIGGAWQMCITKVKPEIRKNIKSIIVPEFDGIDNLYANNFLTFPLFRKARGNILQNVFFLPFPFAALFFLTMLSKAIKLIIVHLKRHNTLIIPRRF